MTKLLRKLGRKTIERIYWIGMILLLIVFSVLAIQYALNPSNLVLIVSALILLLLPVIAFVYAVTVWAWHIEDLINDYKKNDNILSGGLAILVLFALPVIFLLIFLQFEQYTELKNIFEGLLKLIIAAMPAFIGLLGVQYSVAIQERNRKTDIRLGAKPFFKIDCCLYELIPDESLHTSHLIRIRIRLNNISKNIGIPLKLLSCDSTDYEFEFPYNPLSVNDNLEKIVEIKSDKPFSAKADIVFVYEDVYGNTYQSKVNFSLHEDFDLAETKIISDEYCKNKV